MNKNLISNLGFMIKKDEVLVSSRVVANGLGKQHKHLLRDIDVIMERLENNKDFNKDQIWTLFIASEYKGKNGKMNREILMTKQGLHYSVIYEKCKEKVKQYIDLVGTNVKLIGGKNE